MFKKFYCQTKPNFLESIQSLSLIAGIRLIPATPVPIVFPSHPHPTSDDSHSTQSSDRKYYPQWFYFHNSRCFPTFQTEKLSHADLDERALDALKEFPVEVFQEGNVENPATLPSCYYWLASLTFTFTSYFISFFHLFIIFTTSWLKTCISGSPGCPQAVFGIKFGENFSHFRAFNVFTSCLCAI